MGQERLIWLDNLKAFLIIIVVLGHTILFTNHGGTDNIVYRIISSFWMPLFMFSSGFANYRASIGWSIIRRRFFQLMIPFTSWSVILCAINGTFHVERMFLYPTESVWFLFALFFITVIHTLMFNLARKLSFNDEVLVFGMAAIMWILQRVTKTQMFCFGLISYHFVFYTLGFYARKYYAGVLSLSAPCYYIMATGFFLMAFFRHEKYLSMICLPTSTYILYDACCAFLCLVPVVYFFSKYGNRTVRITKVGGVTLGVYVFHIAIYTLLIRMAGDLYINTNSSLHYMAYVIILWQIVFWISYLLTRLTNSTRYGSFILLGKKCI